MDIRKNGQRLLLAVGIAAGLGASATAASATSLTVFASDREVDEVELGTPKYAWWETDTTAKWSSVSKAHEYQVKLYITDDVGAEYNDETGEWEFDADSVDDLEAAAVIRTGDTTCDFSEYMKDLHSYVFVVRATPKVSELAYVKNGAWKVSPEVDFRGKTVQGVTTGKWRNYMEGSRYDTGEGVYLEDGWQLIYGKWYYLAGGGYRQTGWQEIDGKRYYLGERGEMATGWFVYGDSWYYAGKDGVIQTGWIMPQPGKYYYLYEDGRLAQNTEVDGYHVGSDGLRGDALTETQTEAVTQSGNSGVIVAGGTA